MHGSLEHLNIEVDMCAPGWERIVDASPRIDVVAHDIIFGEGPVWDARANALYFTDIIGDTIWKWSPKTGQEIVMRPTVKANGMCLDLERRLVVAGWGGRTVFRREANGSWKTLADRWEGKKLNSPNDIVVKSDGSIWFTDPPGGLLNVGMVGDDVQRYLETQPVFRIAPDAKMTVICEDNVYPNGLCFSPDE
ncbi:MAG TPA: SMP-30/gluconolactonase/LRE family protein, partial [Burkholderiales bacterium]|nr:SMP-30/gluconolactonase/LRE family protein [Burkholderiales bacterium]